MDENKDLLLDDNSKLKWFKKDYKRFLGKTTIIYGSTRSGKSTIIDEIMFLCKEYITSIFVICNSTVTISASTYYQKVPNNCIKNDVSIEWLEKFLEIQKGRTALYDTANGMKTLKSVFDKLPLSSDKDLERRINEFTNKSKISIENNTKIDSNQKKLNIQELDKEKENHLRKLYKSAIRKNRCIIEKDHVLTDDESICIKFLDFNPNMMLIIDDCAANIKKWIKSSTVIKELMYNGSHYHFTQVITAQDDKEIDSEIRKNALISIFTTDIASNANFTRTSNNYSKHMKAQAALCTKRVFKQIGNESKFKKLVYIQHDENPFLFTIADIYDSFRMGQDSLWKIDEKISSRNPNVANHKFVKKYAKH
jgi:hypothetical protein